MHAFGIIGASGSGKTTLITALIPILRARGLTVSTIKHAHHNLTLDQPGKDSFRHAAAGAAEVILATAGGFALFSAAPSPLPALLSRLAPVDLVLVEGFKGADIPRLEVFRAALGKPALWPNVPVAAVATDTALPDCPYPLLPLGNPAAIADFIIAGFAINEPQRVEE